MTLNDVIRTSCVQRALLRIALVCGALVVLAGSAHAQTPFLSNAGYSTAETAAKDSLTDDVRLITVVTTGVNPVTGGDGFNIETGESTFWAYVYYSPSKDDGVVIGVVQLLPGLFAAGGQVIDTMEDAATAPTPDTSGAFSNSNRMAAAIRNNADYQVFREENGTVNTALAQFLRSPEPIPGAPDDFPATDNVWAVAFQDDIDTTKQLICFVAASNGSTFCISGEALGVDDESGSAAQLSMRMVPSPASGRTRVTIAPGTGGRDLAQLRVGLYDLAGRQVLDLTGELTRNDYQYVEFDASTLPAGTYFCRAVGGGFNGVVGTVVTGR